MNYIKRIVCDRMHISQMSAEVHKTAKEKGFWKNNDRNFLEALMLVVSELGECCEAYRQNDWNKVAEELADTMIRVADLAEGFNINIEGEIVEKMEINKKRPFKHNKVC